MNHNIFEIIDLVVKNDYCIGCGACAVFDNSPIEIKLNSDGQYQAYLKNEKFNDEITTTLDSVCPFTNASLNEDEIAKSLFYNKDFSFEKKIGYYDSLFAGYVNEDNYRLNGSSGGVGNWLASELLKQSLVDEIIHVKGGDDMMYMYSISKSIQELNTGAKSRYYPVEMSGVLKYVKETDRRFAIVGIPCFIKAVRLLSNQEKEIDQKIIFTIGLVCGHLKSSLYSEMLAWSLGYKLDSDYQINYREKVPDRKASDYATRISPKSPNLKNQEKIEQNNKIFGTTWGYGFFKYNACDFCDDVVAETADITIGDAWLPEYVDDYLGTNIIISRNKLLTKLILNASKENRINFENLTKEKVVASQAGGFRHRHNGLAYRLYLKDKDGEWRPKKRIQASQKNLTWKRKFIYVLRMTLRYRSFVIFNKAKLKNSYKYFKYSMLPYTLVHEIITKFTYKKIKNKFKRMLFS